MAQLLNTSQRSLIYVDEPLRFGRPVIYKIASYDKTSNVDLENEFHVLSELELEGVRKPITREIFQNKEGFCYEYAAGETLSKIVARAPFTLNQFLRVSIRLTSVLRSLHRFGIFHLGLSSRNILCDTATDEVTVLDFSRARTKPTKDTVDFDDWMDLLPYISPEQTGRLNQVCDARSDLYSLGIIFFEMLTGRLPFDHKDAAKVIHAHLTEEGPALSDIDSRIPTAVAGIVQKLLAKNPDHRYQTAYGLERDLSFCKARFDEGKVIRPFELGTQDRTNKLQLSEKLYGRTDELQVLRQLYKDSSMGNRHIVVLRGESGIGKTALIEAFKQEVVTNNIFLYGNFDQLNSNEPHQALIRALRELALYILALPEDQTNYWRTIIQDAVGDIGIILLELVPDFKWLIGDQPPVEELNGPQSKSRVDFLLQRVVQEVCLAHRPLVVAIDDIESADSASWSNLNKLIGDSALRNFLLILGYRTGAGTVAVDLDKEVLELVDSRQDVLLLDIDKLKVADVEAFLHDSLATDDIGVLAKIVYDKTLGHPFFIHSFIEEAHGKNAIRFDHDENRWRWNKNKVEGIVISDNVATFMSHKVLELPEQDRRALTLVSCLDGAFKAEDLMSIDPGRSLAESQDQLMNLVSEKLLSTEDGYIFNFVHSRIRQSGYDLLSHDERASVHYAYARYLHEKLGDGAELQHYFKTAGHYAKGISRLTSAHRIEVLTLLVRVGVEAKQSAAFDLSFEYLNAARALIESSDWNDHYELVLSLFIEGAESGMVIGAQQQADEMLGEAIGNARHILDKTKAHEIKLSYLSESHQFSETIEYLLLVLKELGYPIDRYPNQLKILREFALAKIQLMGKSPEDLANLDRITNERANAFMRVCVNATVSIFGYAPEILPVVFFREVRLSAKYGNSVYSPFAYCSYAFAIAVFMNQLEKAYDIGRMAMDLVDKLEAKVIKAKVMVTFYGFIAFWKRSFRESIAPLREAYHIGRQQGDLLYACFAASFNTSFRYHVGDNIQELIDAMTEDVKIMRELNQELVYWVAENHRQLLINLVEDKDDCFEFNSDGFNEAEFFERLEAINDQATKFDYYHNKLVLGVIFNKYEEAAEYARLASQFEEDTTSRQISYPSFLLASCLAQLKYDGLMYGHENPAKSRKAIAGKIKLLRRFAKSNPGNFQNKVALVDALTAQREGKSHLALERYENAIKLSQEARFIHEEAIARELVAQLYEEMDNPELAAYQLKTAYKCYENWGAEQKCKQLRSVFPELLGQSSDENAFGISNIQSVFDLTTIIKANQVLSGFSQLEDLCKEFLQIVFNNASVTLAMIILKDGKEYFPKAISRDGQTHYIHSDQSEYYRDFPASIVNIVARTEEPFIADDLSLEKSVAFDAYIQQHQTKSALCIPIMTSDEFYGVLFLENNLASGAFDAGRVEFFQTITAQLAISLENVFLYNEMEEKVNERTRQLSEEKQKSDELLLNILPRETAEELKHYGRTTAKRYDQATILFADIKGFTKIAETLSPEELVRELDELFGAYDRICLKHGLEKIKTIGDAYMAVGGVPDQNTATPNDVVNAALEMRDYATSVRQSDPDRIPFDVLYGINSGPVVAGVVGINKFQFDIWGNAVNVASRVQTMSSAGMVNISHNTYEKVRNDYNIQPRGKLEVKGLGAMEMYYILGPIED